MRVGELVKHYVGDILRYCENDPNELLRLMDAAYSKRKFNIRWPFLTEAGGITSRDHPRYWQDRYVFGDKRLRICSQWYEKDREVFCQYLLSMGIIDKDKLTKSVDPVSLTPMHPRFAIRDDSNRTGNSRFGSTAIGDGQNAVMRFILSKLGEETFDATDWKGTKDYFNNRCAYCDALADLEMDHAIPINKTKLREHRLGNVIPSCRKCNREKHHKDFIEFLGEDKEKIERIKSYMEARNYTPLGDNIQVKLVLEQAHKEI